MYKIKLHGVFWTMKVKLDTLMLSIKINNNKTYNCINFVDAQLILV